MFPAARHFLTFEATPLPKKKGQPRESRPPGRELTRLLAVALEKQGFEVAEPVARHDEYGWYFVVRSGTVPVWLMLQQSDSWMVITEPQVPLFRRLLGEKGLAEHAAVSTAMKKALKQDKRFSRVKFFETEEALRR